MLGVEMIFYGYNKHICLCYLALEQRDLYGDARKEVISLSKGEFDINTFVEHENKLMELLS